VKPFERKIPPKLWMNGGVAIGGVRTIFQITALSHRVKCPYRGYFGRLGGAMRPNTLFRLGDGPGGVFGGGGGPDVKRGGETVWEGGGKRRGLREFVWNVNWRNGAGTVEKSKVGG